MPDYRIFGQLGNNQLETMSNFQNNPNVSNNSFQSLSVGNVVAGGLAIEALKTGANIVTSNFGEFTGDRFTQAKINKALKLAAFGGALLVNPALAIGALAVTGINLGVDTFLRQRNARILAEDKRIQSGNYVDNSRNGVFQ